MEKHNFLLILVFLIQFYSVISISSNDTDQSALLAFRDYITNHSLKNWNTNTSFCSWFGVTCGSKNQRVVALALPDMQLQGTISPSLANLSFLEVLDLGNNFFHGTIPSGLGDLPRLRVIDIKNNQLQGSIPSSLFQHRRVEAISLAFNMLSGEMWRGAWYVPQLRVLDLTNNSLVGTIPHSVGNATKLLRFSLTGNRVSGDIPLEIGNLTQLEKLLVSINQLTGSIPAVLFNISSLISLNLATNRLSGPLLLGDQENPSSKLKGLSIHENQISGSIPSNICRLTELRILSISHNNITGEIPSNIGCLAKLKLFYFGFNSIGGTIPTSLGNISGLQDLHGSTNHIGGLIPPELGKLSNLRKIVFDENYNIFGEIPQAVFNMSFLNFLGFNYNKLSGRIPSTAGRYLPNLLGVYLAGNHLVGEIPAYITNASKLEALSLPNNSLTGTIPTNLGNLRALQYLILQHNQLIAEPSDQRELQFFDSLVNCRMLRYLAVGSNSLNGVLPSSIGNLSSTIVFFEVEYADISGPIPKGIGNMSSLTSLYLQDNNLTSIPSDFGELKQLQGLFLGNNKLQGHFPEVVCRLSRLVQLSLSENHISGLIPECIGNLSMLERLNLSSNSFSSKFPLGLLEMKNLFHLNMSQNSIHGEIPHDIGKLKTIVELDLSKNHLSGVIPSGMGNLQNMQYLSLSNNSFSGSIPSTFANLINLEFMDFSLNSMSGTIPKLLGNLSHLKNINVSFNNLEGEIPNFGVFANSTSQSFIGNKGLCGMQILEVPACVVTNPRQQSKSKKLVLAIVTPLIALFFLISLLVLAWAMKQQRKEKSNDVEKVPEIKTHQLVSYLDIQRATSNFDESNLIGVGGSGSVYKGTLSSGTMVAIKVLDLQDEEVCKRFDTECEVLKNVRHKNLTTVITTCSSEHIRAFVLQYMPNGSLENWLYKEHCALNLVQRVTIMLDVAMAIEYLHHGYGTPIVHCDLKPANVLLDEDMMAHVGDFGISKILAVSMTATHTKTLGTLGYIAPEYGSEGIVSTSGDVYSYGIMLMEVLTKRRPTDEEIYNENLDLRKWIMQAFSRKSVMEVVDANLLKEEKCINAKSELCIASMIDLALDCTKEKPGARITMKDVVTRLNKIKNIVLTI